MKNKKVIIGFAALAVITLSILFIQLHIQNSKSDIPTPIYVTFAGHIEDDKIYLDCDVYQDRRQKLLTIAEMIEASDAAFNLQIEYEFFQGALQCEDDEMMATTNGQNVIDYLATNYGFEIDSHQEGAWDWEGEDNFADVRYIGELVTSSITNTGGLVWNYELQFPELDAGQQGQIYPQFTWYPEILAHAVGYEHHLGNFEDDDLSSGIWIPKGTNDDFYTHTPDGRMVYIGPGPHGNWGDNFDCTFQNIADYIELLVKYMQDGTIDNTKMFTASVTLPQNIMFSKQDKIAETLEQLEPLVEAGYIEYVNYTEVVDIWHTQYNSEPNIFTFDEIDPADYTCS